jgi:preprotein translocase subunit SecF
MIELFKEPNIDWMGKAKYFYALSGILLIAGWTSIFMQGGLRYSIDFKGGTNVDVRFAQPPDIDKIRKGLTARGLANNEIQAVRDIASSDSNELLIFVEQRNQGDEAGDASKTQVINALNAIYGTANSSKPDLNFATLSSLTAFLTTRDPLLLSTNAGDRYQQLARKILDYRDTKSKGVLTSLDDLSKVEGVTPAVISLLKYNYALGSFATRGVEIVGPKVVGDLRRQVI